MLTTVKAMGHISLTTKSGYSLIRSLQVILEISTKYIYRNIWTSGATKTQMNSCLKTPAR
jgi:hypothetical protein